jgi:UDP-glucose 4-epimerase
MEYRMKSLVTGGAGFIGSHLVDTLISNGHEVICIDNESSGLNTNFYWNDLAKNYKLDITDYNSIRPLFDNVDFVFHLAAESRLQPAILDPTGAVFKNVFGTTVVLQCSREANVKRFIYSSTSSGYGNNPKPNYEDQKDDCLNPYSMSKVAAEKVCKLYTDLYGLQTIILRYFNVYGERSPDGGQYAPVIGIFLKQYRDGLPLTVVGDGSQRRDFVHVHDVVRSNIMFAEADIQPSSFGQIYNVATGTNLSVIEIAKSISSNIVFIESRLGEAIETLADISKISNAIGWVPNVDALSWIDGQI